MRSAADTRLTDFLGKQRSHLVWLEMLGLVFDSATGVKLTASGRSIADSQIEPVDQNVLQFDRSGSRKMGTKVFLR